VLAGERNELVALAALRHLYAVLVGPLLDLAVAPALEKCIAERLLSASSCGGGRSVILRGALGCEVSVAADSRNELVTVARLRDWDATLVEPSLQVRVGPRGVKPVTRVRSGLSGLVGDGLVVGTDSGEKRIAGARRRVGNAVVIKECLELRFGPAVRGCMSVIGCVSSTSTVCRLTC
jgi:hypothetical protein